MDETTWTQIRDQLVNQLNAINFNTVLSNEQMEGGFMSLARICKFDFDTSFIKIGSRYALLFGLEKQWDDPELAGNLSEVFEQLKGVVMEHFNKTDNDLLFQIEQAIKTDPAFRAEVEALLPGGS